MTAQQENRTTAVWKRQERIMWARTTATQCVSLRSLRNRSTFSQGYRNSWRGYRYSRPPASSVSLPESRRFGSTVGCLSHDHDNENRQQNEKLNETEEIGSQWYREMHRHSSNAPCRNSLDSESHVPSLCSQHPEPIRISSRSYTETEPLVLLPLSLQLHRAKPSSLQRLQRARFALAACLALDEMRNSLESHHHTSRTRRSFSSSSDGSPNKKGDTSNDQRTDPDFAEYLAGTTDEATNSANASVDATKTPPTEAPIDLEGTEVPLDDHTETYRFIRRRQQNSWELAREKTTVNVQRALVGNMLICTAKLGAYLGSGSSSMFSEFIHSVVDCGNQSLLLLGLRDAGNRADRKHPYGYGKSIYFYALVSALGTFFLGAGVSGTQAWGELMDPSLHEITWHVWGVLGFSFVVDGYVLGKTVGGIKESIPKESKLKFWSYAQTIRDPATLAVLLEDGAACLGIVIAIGGIAASSSTGMPVFDGMAGLAISGLLASMGLVLVRINQRFLLGQAVDPEITNGIERILLSQRSIDAVHSVQSQWTGPDSFSFKAEVDFDGTYLAAKLMPRYQAEFLQIQDDLDSELRVLLSWYAEDVMRTVEREVRHVEAEIRKRYPAAAFIELEPMSKDADRFAVDDGMEAQLRRIEIESLNRYLRTLYQPGSAKSKSDTKSDGDKKDDGNSPSKL